MIWKRNANRHWTSGDFTIVPMSANRFGLVHKREYLGTHDFREDAARAAGCPVARWVLR